MSRLFNLILGGIAGLAVFANTASATAQSVSSARDFDSNALCYGGTLTVRELRDCYNAKPGVRVVFRHFGIGEQDIATIGNQMVVGQVTKSGNVIVDGRIVAANAMTAGRQHMPGSTAVTRNGMTFYTRPTNVSFASSSLSAFVVMKNGSFDYAVLTSCGNPVKANAIVKKVVQPPVKKPVVQPQPPVQPIVVQPPTVVVQQQQQQQQSQPVTQGAQQQQPAAQQQQQPAGKSLPDTGAGNILGLGAAAAIAGTITHSLYLRRKA